MGLEQAIACVLAADGEADGAKEPTGHAIAI